MIHPEFDLVIFDCDGTLVDSEPITTSVLLEQTRDYGLDLAPEEALGLFVGRDMPGIVRWIEQRIKRKLPADFTANFRLLQAAALRESLLPIPGAEALLGAMQREICLASNAPRDKIAINLNVTRLSRFFDQERTFSAYDIQSWKPEPDLFLHAAASLGYSPERCVVIEDSLAGITAAEAAGMQVIGYAKSQNCLPTTRIPFVHSLFDLVEILNAR